MTQDETDVVTKLSPHPVADTVSKLTGIISAKGIRLFAVIDQSAEARQAGLSLRETTLVIFGSPVAGTPSAISAGVASAGARKNPMLPPAANRLIAPALSPAS